MTRAELRTELRARILDAFYDARNAGETMHDAADEATTRVLQLFDLEERGGEAPRRSRGAVA